MGGPLRGNATVGAQGARNWQADTQPRRASRAQVGEGLVNVYEGRGEAGRGKRERGEGVGAVGVRVHARACMYACNKPASR